MLLILTCEFLPHTIRPGTNAAISVAATQDLKPAASVHGKFVYDTLMSQLALNTDMRCCAKRWLMRADYWLWACPGNMKGPAAIVYSLGM